MYSRQSLGRVFKTVAAAVVFSMLSGGCVVAGGYGYHDRGDYGRYERYDRGYGHRHRPHFVPQWGPPPVVYAPRPMYLPPRPMYAPGPSFYIR